MSEFSAGEPQKLLTSGRARLTVAAACGLVLTAGALTTPRPPQSAAPVPQEHAAPLLEEQVQRREAANSLQAVQEIADRLGTYTVPIAPISVESHARNDYSEDAGETPALTGAGVFVAERRVLTHIAALPARIADEISIDGRRAKAEVVAYDRQTGLVLLQVAGVDGRPMPPVALDPPAAGTPAVAVGRFDGRVVVIPVYLTSVGADALTVGAVGGPLPAGTAIFNLAGELCAVIGSGGAQQRAIPARRAVERLSTIASTGEQPQASLGVGYQALSGRLTDAFGAEGVVITDVVPDGPADTAGVRVGDVLLAIGTVTIESAAAVETLLSAAAVGTPTTLHVRRAGRVTNVRAIPAAAYEVAMLASARADMSQAPEARVALPADVLRAGDISPSAQLISVDGRRLTTPEEALRSLRAARQPVRVLLREGRVQFFVIVEPVR